jgi:hypothetical protein
MGLQIQRPLQKAGNMSVYHFSFESMIAAAGIRHINAGFDNGNIQARMEEMEREFEADKPQDVSEEQLASDTTVLIPDLCAECGRPAENNYCAWCNNPNN